MDTNKLIKSVIQENIIESKKIATEILLQKLSERLQSKFQEYAPETFLDEKKDEELDPVGKEDEDVDNDGDSDESDDYIKNRRSAVARAMKDEDEGDEEEEEDEEEEDEGDEGDEDDGEEKGEYGRSSEEAGENDAEKMNRKAFFPTSMSESKKFKGRKAN
jgi:hypothetical protein